MKTPEERSVDPASIEMLKRTDAEGLPVTWDRYEAMQPQCGFGHLGLCCKNCAMGPCRIDPFGNGPSEGICGASADVIAARNLARMIAAGTAAHSDHARSVTHTVLLAAQGSDYAVKDERKLRRLAEEWEIDADGKDISQLAKEVAETALAEFGRQEGHLRFVSRAPAETQRRWEEADVTPRGVDREVVSVLHRTHVGSDSDMKNIIMGGVRTALADGWGGSMIGTELTDVLFTSPAWLRSETNLGVINPKNVNIIVHGHEPILSEMIVAACQDPALIELAKSTGAEGITLREDLELAVE